MNLVKDILDQCTGSLGSLSSLLGADEDTTSYAAGAAVPALMAGLASAASRGDTAGRAVGALNSASSFGMDDVADMLRGNPDAVADRGANLLNALFGDAALSGLVGSLSKYAGLGGGMVKKLLALLAPMVLSKVASAWKARGGTTEALTGLMADQRANIAQAMPAGLSLADVPGWSAGAGAAASASRRAVATADAASRSASSWLVPAALALVGAFLLWSVLQRRAGEDTAVKHADQTSEEVTAMKPVTPAPEIPAEATQASDELRKILSSASETLGEIKDADSADAARAKLEELSAKIDGMKKMLAPMAATNLSTLKATAEKPMAELREQANKVLETPGLAEDIKTLINGIVQKLMKLFG
jgi:hypothetical protein